MRLQAATSPGAASLKGDSADLLSGSSHDGLDRLLASAALAVLESLRPPEKKSDAEGPSHAVALAQVGASHPEIPTEL